MEAQYNQPHFFPDRLLRFLGDMPRLTTCEDDEELKKTQEVTFHRSSHNKTSPPDEPEGGSGRGSDYYCNRDFRIQIFTSEILQRTCWYYPDTSSQLAKKLLHRCPEGTFIVRDSSDPKYLYSISVKTSRGATSVRVLYSKGYYQLDCEEKLKHQMPKFDCVVKLIDHYVRASRRGNNSCRWLESTGRKDLQVLLREPKRNNVSDLKHLCRLTLNNSLPDTNQITKTKDYIEKLPLPTSLMDYVKDYPYLR